MSRALRFSIALFCVFAFSAAVAGAQSRFDAYFGLGTVRMDSDVFNDSGSTAEIPGMDGIFGTFGGAVFLKPSFGIGGQVSVRFAQGEYGPYGYRPVFYDFNGIWTPLSDKRIVPEFQAGFGGVNLRFYDPGSPYYDYYSGGYTTYAGSSNHLQLHAAAGLRIYVKERIFIRPQIDYHWVRNMNEFSSNSVPAFSIAIGFTAGDRR